MPWLENHNFLDENWLFVFFKYIYILCVYVLECFSLLFFLNQKGTTTNTIRNVAAKDLQTPCFSTSSYTAVRSLPSKDWKSWMRHLRGWKWQLTCSHKRFHVVFCWTQLGMYYNYSWHTHINISYNQKPNHHIYIYIQLYLLTIQLVCIASAACVEDFFHITSHAHFGLMGLPADVHT